MAGRAGAWPRDDASLRAGCRLFLASTDSIPAYNGFQRMARTRDVRGGRHGDQRAERGVAARDEGARRLRGAACRDARQHRRCGVDDGRARQRPHDERRRRTPHRLDCGGSRRQSGRRGDGARAGALAGRGAEPGPGGAPRRPSDQPRGSRVPREQGRQSDSDRRQRRANSPGGSHGRRGDGVPRHQRAPTPRSRTGVAGPDRARARGHRRDLRRRHRQQGPAEHRPFVEPWRRAHLWVHGRRDDRPLDPDDHSPRTLGRRGRRPPPAAPGQQGRSLRDAEAPQGRQPGAGISHDLADPLGCRPSSSAPPRSRATSRTGGRPKRKRRGCSSRSSARAPRSSARRG